VLEHAAELNHQIGDRVSEAISYGQLGSSALARGELEQAKTHLQRQEWFASRVGDSFGQARALVLLADLAIDLGRYDDAIDLATQARTIAGQVTPPLTMWVAYATRSIGRALLELEDPGADAELQHARDHFERMGNQLGEALVSWDMARRGARRGGDEQALRAVKEAWRTSAWSFATLGLTGRVTQVLADARAHTEDEDEAAALDRIVAASGQSYPHLGHAQEVELVLSRPDTVSAIATRRIAGQRNLGRLAAQTLAPPGLLIAAVAAAAVGQGSRALPTPRSAATAIGQLPGVALWAWSPEVSAAEVARDLSALRVALGDDTRAALGWFAEAHIVSAPFAGELGAELEAADLSALIAHALTDPPSSLRRLDGVTWDNEAEALARMSGFESA
jgi:tetratricopeptide (TPR) repeat protein